MSDLKLIDWLNAPCLPDELLSISFDSSKKYLPIERVREKFAFMQKEFNAVIRQDDIQFNCHNTFNKDTLCWATVKFTVFHSEFPEGKWVAMATASFFMGQYTGSWSIAQIAESIATTRAFGKDWEQFGKSANKEVDAIKDFKSPTGAKANVAVKETLKNLPS